MTRRYLPSHLRAWPWVRMQDQPVGYCKVCDGPRPRQRGRTLCWYCQKPNKRCTREPTPIERR